MFDLEVYDGEIFYFIDVINDPGNLIRLIESSDNDLIESDCISKWVNWSSGDYQFGYRKEINSAKLGTSSENSYKIYQELNHAVNSVLENYKGITSNEIGLRTPFGISKYNTGSYMGKHVDDYEDYDKNPTVSGILYLNDEYQGGELFFEDQGVKIKPSAGSMVVFPSREPYFHESLEIIDGVKYMCPIFCYTNKVI